MQSRQLMVPSTMLQPPASRCSEEEAMANSVPRAAAFLCDSCTPSVPVSHMCGAATGRRKPAQDVCSLGVTQYRRLTHSLMWRCLLFRKYGTGASCCVPAFHSDNRCQMRIMHGMYLRTGMAAVDVE